VVTGVVRRGKRVEFIVANDLSTQTYLTAQEAAEYLRFPSVKAFREYVRRHPLPTCRAGARRLLYRRRDLDRAVTAHAGGVA